jgi:hypothetical protein
MNRLLRMVLHWIQRRCDHVEMKADILEGEGRSTVAWCETCGAVRINNREIRTPEPTWHPFCPVHKEPMTLHPNGNFYECPRHFGPGRCDEVVSPW